MPLLVRYFSVLSPDLDQTGGMAPERVGAPSALGCLRHQDLVEFVQKHKLSWDWVSPVI
jgi:hypothetical protein